MKTPIKSGFKSANVADLSDEECLEKWGIRHREWAAQYAK